MCSNCAFRKGSEERDNPERWAEVMGTVTSGQNFYCHKGLPMRLSNDKQTADFAAPDPDAGRVTVCAGWLAMYMASFKCEVA